MKNIILKIMTALIVVGVLVSALPAFAEEQTDEFTLPEIPDDLTGGNPWIASIVEGNVTADTETSPVEDFYLYANKEWIISNKIPEGLTSIEYDYQSENRAHLLDALAGEELSEHDARQAQLFYEAFMNTDARDAAGCEPVKKVIDDIKAVSDISTLTDFLLDLDRSAGVPGLFQVKNSRNHAENCWDTEISLADGMFGATINTMGMDAATIDPESEIYQLRRNLVVGILTRIGFTDEEAGTIFDGRLELERELIRLTEEKQADEEEPAALDMDQLESYASHFPLRKLAETRGYGKAEKIYIPDEAEIQAANEIYNDEHLDALRDYLICGYVLETGSWLDMEAFEAWSADHYANSYEVIADPEGSLQRTAFNLEVITVPTLIGRAYVEGCSLAEVKNFMESLCHAAIEAHKEIVNASEWLSDAGKEKLTEKLDAETIQVVYPEVWEDYSGLSLDGLDYYGVRRAVWFNDIERNAALTGTEIDRRIWDTASLFGAGGLYDYLTNSFRIEGGSVEGKVNSYLAGEISFEELLGGPVGYVIFHEIGHALDSVNIYYDLNGNEMDEALIGGADLEEFKRRVKKIETYLDGISIWEGQQVVGSICVKEALAEINGMQARLAYAAKQTDFDYRTFFESRARMVPILNTPEQELMNIYGMDFHPSRYIDTNLTVQQFEEFMNAFDVKEGDTMYLAPEDRLVLW